MNPDEVPAVLDVHPPHHAPSGARDFFLHLFTITIGLLIALSLEGLVEWQHHKHLAHDAATSMRNEIASNAKGMPDTIADVKKRQDELSHDIDVLKQYIRTKKFPKTEHMSIGFGVRTFDAVSWRTAQSTNALAYMPYDEAEEFSGIYNQQELLFQSEQVGARDAMIALGPFLSMKESDPDPTLEQAQGIIDKIGVLQGQLLLISSYMSALNTQYTEFLKKHPH